MHTKNREQLIAALSDMPEHALWALFDSLVPPGSFLSESAHGNPKGWYASAQTELYQGSHDNYLRALAATNAVARLRGDEPDYDMLCQTKMNPDGSEEAIDQPSPLRLCPTCGQSSRGDEGFCDNCGQNLNPATVSEQFLQKSLYRAFGGAMPEMLYLIGQHGNEHIWEVMVEVAASRVAHQPTWYVIRYDTGLTFVDACVSAYSQAGQFNNQIRHIWISHQDDPNKWVTGFGRSINIAHLPPGLA